MSAARSLLEPLIDHPAIRTAVAEVSAGKSRVVLSGLTRPAKALVAAILANRLRRPVLVLTSDNETADRLCETASTALEWLAPEAPPLTSVLPAWDCSPYEGRSPHADISERRAVALWNLTHGRIRLLCVPLPAVLTRFRDRRYYSALALELNTGEELDPEDLVEHLAAIGYESGEPVENVGQFSVRGGIVDVFPPEAEYPFRIEFFGERIESLREFDPNTQRSRHPVASALLLPLSEHRRSSKLFQSLVQTLLERVNGRLKTEGEPEWAPLYTQPFPGWEFFTPLADPHPSTIFSLADQPVLVWDEPSEREEQLRQTLEGWATAYDEVSDIVPPRPRPEGLFLTKTEFRKALEGVPQIALKELAIDVGGDTCVRPASSTTSPEDASRFGGTPLQIHFVLHAQPVPKFQAGIKELIDHLRVQLKQHRSVAFVIPTGGQAERLREILSEYEIPYSNLDVQGHAREGQRPAPAANEVTLPSALAPGAVLLARGELEEGIIFPELGLVLLSDQDLFGRAAWAAAGRRERSGISSFISSLSDLKGGDYVVHVDHGIGLYRGLRQLEVDGALRDFMLLTYQDDAKLYVPLERLDLVEKYRASGDGAKPQLDRLGGATWERTKTRVKRALRDMAQELLQLYAERKMRGGVATSSDSPWQKEFEDSFEFEETPDQVTAMAEIKKDLENPEPMDRLLCGDVGYGKTELAMRAAFKAVQDSRQVALLAPTTVLAFQHFETFKQRMAPFPVKVEMLSRFRSAAEQKKILSETEAGKVDILIGTHRLLSKDLRFRDLGLLIVDEEQRFGVAAKEKLKKLKVGVDVLTLSATPIPRTLHMSLGGLRDLSVIETPPRGRLAIQTTVALFSEGLIQAAVLQEMERHGQVYFVHNRVESIFSIAALVHRLVPTVRIGVTHGQMGERELEKAMLKFMHGEYDVLVATALIENGLDIPRANTIIINHADRFGLADLYQLRGRVGRSNRRAYAHFLVPSEETLTPTAKRRLAALKEFSELGAGFRLAALDLELRGAGNLLGREQHGHLNAIGIDLYLKMLEQTVEELKGAAPRLEVRTTLGLGLDIRIPDAYIADESQRLRMYKRISTLSDSQACAALESELIDRYGPLPLSVRNLLNYALLKSAAESVLVRSIERRASEVWVRFHQQAPVDPRKLTQFVRRHRGSSFRPDGLLRFPLHDHNGNLFEQIQNVLQELRTAN